MSLYTESIQVILNAIIIYDLYSLLQSVPTDRVSDKYYVLTCSQHFVTSDIVSYLMILVAYPLALYMFRVTEPEHLATLAETVIGSAGYICMRGVGVDIHACMLWQLCCIVGTIDGY